MMTAVVYVIWGYCILCALGLTIGRVRRTIKVDVWVIVATAALPLVAIVGLSLGFAICLLMLFVAALFFLLVPVLIALGSQFDVGLKV